MAQVTFRKDNVDVLGMVLTPADFVNGVWETDVESAMNAKRVTVNVLYQELTPNGADVNVDYRLQAAVLGEESDGTYTPIVSQFSSAYSSEFAPTRRMIFTDGPTAYEPNTPHIISDALGKELIEISVEDAIVPEKIKVSIALADLNSGNADLTSFKVTITGRID